MAYPEFTQEWQNEYLEQMFDMEAWEQMWSQASSLSDLGDYDDYPEAHIGGPFTQTVFPGGYSAWENLNPGDISFDFTNYIQNSWMDEYGKYLPELNVEHLSYLQDKAEFNKQKTINKDLRQLKSSQGMYSTRGVNLYDVIMNKSKMKDIESRKIQNKYTSEYATDFLDTVGTLIDADAFTLGQADNPYVPEGSSVFSDFDWGSPELSENILQSDVMCMDSCVECSEDSSSAECFACVNEFMQYVASTNV